MDIHAVMAEALVVFDGFSSAAVGPPVAYTEPYTSKPIVWIFDAIASDIDDGTIRRMVGPKIGFSSGDRRFK